jgi:hypothetical protein
MEHSYWEERVQAYIDNELSPADHTAVEQHVEECQACQKNVVYFKLLKRRLKDHTAAVEMPVAVRERIERQFSRRRRFRPRRYLLPSAALALAAILVLALLPLQWGADHFSEIRLVGKTTCYDCNVADRAGLEMGQLCKDGHRLGIICPDGTMWRIAADEKGVTYLRDLNMMGKQVEIHGQILKSEHLLRVDSLQEVAAAGALSDRASLSGENRGAFNSD